VPTFDNRQIIDGLCATVHLRLQKGKKYLENDKQMNLKKKNFKHSSDGNKGQIDKYDFCYLSGTIHF